MRSKEQDLAAKPSMWKWAFNAFGNARWAFAVLGTLASSFALISLWERLSAGGLAPVFQSAVDTYRLMVHPLIGILLHWISWFAPHWMLQAELKDAASLSLLFAAAKARARYVTEIGEPYTRSGYVWVVTLTLLQGATFIGLLIPLKMVIDAVRPVDRVVAFAKAEARYLADENRDRPWKVRLFGEVVELPSLWTIEYYQSMEIEAERRRIAFARAVLLLIFLSVAVAFAFFALNAIAVPQIPPRG